MRSDKIVYKLVVEDLQDVAKEEIGRALTDEEIKIVTTAIEDNLPWWDIVSLAITQKIDD